MHGQQYTTRTVVPVRAMGANKGKKSAHSWPLHYMAVSSQMHAPATSSPGKNPVHNQMEDGWGPTVSLDGFREVKISFSPRDSKPQAEQPAASRYIDCSF